MGLQGLLIGGLQAVEEVLRLPNVVTVEAPVAPEGEDQTQQPLRDSLREENVGWGSRAESETHFLAMNRASESASCMPFLMVSVKTATFLG